MLTRIYDKLVEKSYIFFYIFWSILLIGKGLGYTNKDSIFVYMTYFSLIFAALKLVFTKYTMKELIVVIILHLIGIIVWRCSNSTTVLLTIIVLVSCKDIQMKNLFKYSFWVKTLFFICVTTLAILNVIDPGKIERLVNGVYLGIRYCLGYGHPNSCQYTLFTIFILFIYAYKEKINLYHILIMALYNYFIYTYTDSNTGFMLCNLIIAYLVIKKTYIHKYFEKIMYFCCDYIYILLVPISFICCYLSSEVGMLNNLGTLSARFWTASAIIKNYPFSLFGTLTTETDFGFIKIIYSYGLIITILYVLGHTFLLKYLKKKKLTFEYFSIVLLAIYSLLESYSMSILMNATLFMFLYFTEFNSKYEKETIPNLFGSLLKNKKN